MRLWISAVAMLFAGSAFGRFLPKKIYTGGDFACALSDAGKVKCWGYNNDGQLGTQDGYNYGKYPNSMGRALPTMDFGSDVKVAEMCIGGRFACIATPEGKVKCWGDNFDGSLGHGNVLNPKAMGDALPFTDLGTGFVAKNLSCGYRHACALTPEGRAKCWGDNNTGNLVLGDEKTRGNMPGQMGDALPYFPTSKKILNLSASSNTTCALFEDGARCWGYNAFGQLGQENRKYTGHSPETANDMFPAIKIWNDATGLLIRKVFASGHNANCVLYSRNNRDAIKCWGQNSSAILGTSTHNDYGGFPNTMGDNLPEVDLNLPEGIVDAQGHDTFTCTLSKTGRVKCWGWNNVDGSLGLGEPEGYRGGTPQSMGKYLPALDLGLPAKALSEGTFSRGFACAILINNMAKCWGSNSFGQLGYEDAQARGSRPGDMGDALPFINLGD